MANNATLIRRQTSFHTSGNTVQSIPPKTECSPTNLWDRPCFLFVKTLLGETLHALCFYVCVSLELYFLSFQTNHWSLWDTNKTSSKQLHLESKQHHLGTQIIKELYEMSSDGESYLKLVHIPSLFSHVWLFVSLWTIARQAPVSMGFSRQEYGSGLPCSPPGHLPDPGIEPVSLMAPALHVDSLPLSHWGSPGYIHMDG